MNILAAICTSAACAVLCACAVPGEPPVVVECKVPASSSRPGPALVGQTYGMAMTPLPLNSVQFGSSAVARSLAVQSLYAGRVANDHVQVTARLVSCGDGPAAVRVRTSFMRSDTSPSEPSSAWKTVFLEPRATALYSELSTNAGAASYLIEIAP